jgi:hypothetical protein
LLTAGDGHRKSRLEGDRDHELGAAPVVLIPRNALRWST